jgi:hypothetical protein
MKLHGLIAPLLALTLAGCEYERRENGQPDQVGHDRTGAALTFGTVSQVQGTRFFTIPIVRMEHGASGSFTKSYAGSDERNRLIVDSATGASRKVLPNTDFAIVNWIEPTSVASDASEYSARDGSTGRATGLYAAVVDRPGSTEKDAHTFDLLFGRFEDGQQAWVARRLSGVEAVWMTQDGKIAVVAASGDRGIYRLYDAKSFQQLLEAPLSL